MYETFNIEFQWVYFNVLDILFIFLLPSNKKCIHTDHETSRWNKQFIFLFQCIVRFNGLRSLFVFQYSFKLNEMPNEIRPSWLKSISISRTRERETKKKLRRMHKIKRKAMKIWKEYGACQYWWYWCNSSAILTRYLSFSKWLHGCKESMPVLHQM